MTAATQIARPLGLHECLRRAGFHEDDWPRLTASQRAIAVVMAHAGSKPQPVKRLPERAARPKERVVYFLGAGRFVKIGYSHSTDARMRELQIGCPFKIKVLAKVGGARAEERALHATFAAYRAHGEWFRREGALAEYIKGLR